MPFKQVRRDSELGESNRQSSERHTLKKGKTKKKVVEKKEKPMTEEEKMASIIEEIGIQKRQLVENNKWPEPEKRIFITKDARRVKSKRPEPKPRKPGQMLKGMSERAFSSEISKKEQEFSDQLRLKLTQIKVTGQNQRSRSNSRQGAMNSDLNIGIGQYG